jgi:hypothetical protein
MGSANEVSDGMVRFIPQNKFLNIAPLALCATHKKGEQRFALFMKKFKAFAGHTQTCHESWC